MGKNKIPYVNLPDYRRARQILADFNKNNEKYMRNLVANVTRDGIYADSLDFSALRKESVKILGVVRKIAYGSSLLKNINSLRKTKNTKKRELLEERICIQLEGCRVPDNSYPIIEYEKARKQNK